MSLDTVTPSEQDSDLDWVKVWFQKASNPPNQMWKEVLPKLKKYTIQTGYIKDKPHFCYMKVCLADTVILDMEK